MPILLPLTILGFGFLLVQLFTGATVALPLAIGVAAGFAGHALGCSPSASFAIGTATFMAVIALGRFAALTLPSRHARLGVIALFAIPAAIAGYSTAAAIASLAGFPCIAPALVAATLCAGIAAHRLRRPAT